MASHKRQTHEQLRIDHIETLEELQKAKDEIDRLRSELIKYESSMPSDSSGGSSPAKPAKEESLLEYVEKIRKQEKEIQDLKTLMRRTSLEDQQRFNSLHARTIEEFSQQLNKMQLRDRELSAQVQGLEVQLEAKQPLEERIAAMQSEITSLRTQLTHQTASASHRAQELLEASEEKSQLLLALGQAKTQLAEALEARRTCLACDLKQKMIQDRDISLLEQQRECDRWQHQAAEYVESIQFLQKEVDELKAKLASNLPTPPRDLAVDFRDSDSEDETAHRSRVRTPSSSSIGCAPQSQSAANSPPEETSKDRTRDSLLLAVPFGRVLPPRTEDEDAGSVLSSGAMSVRFQEFIRLKRENKELKLRLADLYASSNTSHSFSMRTQLSASNLAAPGPQASGLGSGLGSEKATTSAATGYGSSVAGPTAMPLRKGSSTLRLVPMQSSSRTKAVR